MQEGSGLSGGGAPEKRPTAHLPRRGQSPTPCWGEGPPAQQRPCSGDRLGHPPGLGPGPLHQRNAGLPEPRSPPLSPRGPCQGSIGGPPQPSGWAQQNTVGAGRDVHLHICTRPQECCEGGPQLPQVASWPASVHPINGQARPEPRTDLLTQAAGLPHPVRVSSIANHPAAVLSPLGNHGRTTTCPPPPAATRRAWP